MKNKKVLKKSPLKSKSLAPAKGKAKSKIKNKIKKMSAKSMSKDKSAMKVLTKIKNSAKKILGTNAKSPAVKVKSGAPKAVTKPKTEKPTAPKKSASKKPVAPKVPVEKSKPVPAVKVGKLKANATESQGKLVNPSKPPKAPVIAIGELLCRESGCENTATTKGYCRLDYIKNWKKIKRKEMILKEGKLNQYIEELVSKYPDRYMDVIRQDLSTEITFNKVITDLELDESIDDLDYDNDTIDELIGGIRKDDSGFDDSDF